MRSFQTTRKIARIAVAMLALTPVFARDQIAWVKDYGSALKQAANEKKFVVLDISASW